MGETITLVMQIPILPLFSKLLLAILILIPSLGWSLHFYRSPQSLFSSGEIRIDKLQKSAISTEFIFDFLVESNHRKQWISASKMARDLDLSDKVTYHNTEYSLKEIHGYWALVERVSDGKKDWAPALELVSASNCQGKSLTLISTSLRAGPSWTDELILQLPAKTALKILEIEDSWLKVEFETITGYVDLNNVLMKADFATEIMDLKGQWHKVKYRDGFQMVLENGKNLSLAKVSEWKTDSKRGIMIESLEDKKLLLRQNLLIEKVQAQVWTQSQLSGHGRVFWKKSDASAKTPDAVIISSEEFLKREIFSVSFDGKNPLIGLVSSHGVFKSTDGGLNWELLPQFKNENHPVSISPEGHWFVGFMKSHDQGKSFSEYLRTDSLTRLIQSQSRGAPRILRLSDIAFQKSTMQIKVDTGIKTIRLATKSKEDLISEWDFID